MENDHTSSLSSHIDRLIQFLVSVGLQPPSQNVRIIEVDDKRMNIKDRTLHVRRKEPRTPLECENRFDELLRTGYSWLNLSCYGVYKDLLIVAVEIPSATVPPEGKPRTLHPAYATSVNISGPNNGVLAHQWSTDFILTIE